MNTTYGIGDKGQPWPSSMLTVALFDLQAQLWLWLYRGKMACCREPCSPYSHSSPYLFGGMDISIGKLKELKLAPGVRTGEVISNISLIDRHWNQGKSRMEEVIGWWDQMRVNLIENSEDCRQRSLGEGNWSIVGVQSRQKVSDPGRWLDRQWKQFWSQELRKAAQS